jgi:hypothetical protein
MSSKNFCVIGSGPSGLAAAYALLKRNCSVTILDPGFKIEESKKHFQFPTGKPDLQLFKTFLAAGGIQGLDTKSKIPDKLLFGSDFMYRELGITKLQQLPPVKVLTSLAYGGLSNNWGSNISTIGYKDTLDWEIDREELKQSYDELAQIIPISSQVDQVDQAYMFELSGQMNHPECLQTKALLKRVNTSASVLKKEGIFAGRSKLAIGRMYSTEAEGCVSCGYCMQGCIYKTIFNSAFGLERLKSEFKQLRYKENFLVEKIVEKETEVLVEGLNLLTQVRETISYSKVFVGAGVFGTAKILANSFQEMNKEFTIKDSQKYLFLFKLNSELARQVSGASKQQIFGLSQVFFETEDERISEKLVHSQLYGYTDLLLEGLAKYLGSSVKKVVKQMFPSFLDRLMIGMTYFHSEDSGYLKFLPTKYGADGMGTVRGSLNEITHGKMRILISKVNKQSEQLGGKIMGLTLTPNPPGNSLHYGASLPMKKAPNDSHETDLLGRPIGKKRIHIIDSSVLPSVPGTPTTFTVMANANRIARLGLT